MKRILTFSIVSVLAIVVLASCSKRDHWRDDNNSDVENGVVKYSPKGYEYYSVVQLYDSYVFIETMDDSPDSWPYEQENLRGTFYDTGDNRVYNQTGGFWTTVRVRGFYNTQSQAENAVDRYIYQKYGTIKSTPAIPRSATRNGVSKIQ